MKEINCFALRNEEIKRDLLTPKHHHLPDQRMLCFMSIIYGIISNAEYCKENNEPGRGNFQTSSMFIWFGTDHNF